MSIVTRRSIIGALVVVVAGAAGATAEFVRHPRRGTRHPGSGGVSTSTGAASPPVAPILTRALARERDLISRLDQAFRATPALRGRVGVLRADHQAHVDALSALITAAGAPPTSTSAANAAPTTPAATAGAAGRAQVLAWERANAAAAGLDCPSATGGAAAVLASIYACEQTHLAWLA